MAGPTSPSSEGPSFAPPSLPPGWIAQWDGASKKYYYVQLATGASQWEIPTQAAKTGSTPGQAVEHPYGAPPPELITHPDGSQTVKHPDGTMEPIMADGTRGVDGQAGDRGLGVSCAPLHSSTCVSLYALHGRPRPPKSKNNPSFKFEGLDRQLAPAPRP